MKAYDQYTKGNVKYYFTGWALQNAVGGRGRSRRLSVDSFLEGYFKSKITISLQADEGSEQTFQLPPPSTTK